MDKTAETQVINILQNVVEEYYNGGREITGYRSGDCARINGVEELYRRVNASMEYVQDRSDEIASAAGHFEEVWLQRVAEYEEDCRERSDAGIAQILFAAATIVGGAIVVYFSAGAATPCVIGIVSGSFSIHYGVSEVCEGVQNVYYGANGDLTSAAFNPIRDTIFFGNQSVYNAWGDLSTTVSSLCVPGGALFNTGTRAGASTLFRPVIRELATDWGVGMASQGITNWIGAQNDYSQSQMAWTNLALNVAIGGEFDRISSYASRQMRGVSNSFAGLADADVAGSPYIGQRVPEAPLRGMGEVDVPTARMVDDVREVMDDVTPSNANRDCLFGEEHYAAYIEMYGTENVEWTSRDTLSSADRLRIQDWTYPPATDELYLRYRNVYQNDLYFNQVNGNVNWPIHDGFVPDSINYETLREGHRFMRIGGPSGEFLGTTTDSFGERSLAPFSDPDITDTPIRYYELLDDMEFQTGEIAPWFDFEGGGKQFLAYKPNGKRYTVQELLDADILKDITVQVEKGEIIIDTSTK